MIMDSLFSDKLGSTVFAPVKMDFVGNIKVCDDLNQTSLFHKRHRYIFVHHKVQTYSVSPFLFLICRCTQDQITY